ncbi:MAG: hypothetical protein IPG50_18665 [Myxococcales bacterium]|nr:hypothetical protein [Myxococcales bacterium]
MRPNVTFLVRTACVATFALTPSVARADVTSWLGVGSGVALQHSEKTGADETVAPLSLSVGVGSSPRAAVVVGGLLRTVTYFSLGTDLGLALRATTGGFARGQFGVAVDAGMVGRWWNGGDFGRYPFQGVVTLGAPWGLGLALGAQVGTLDDAAAARGGFAMLEIDFLRLTVMRQGPTDRVWFNPAPAGGREPR